MFSPIDYTNSLYFNLPNYRLNKLNIYFHAPISKMQHNVKILDADKKSFLKSVLLVHNIIYSTRTSNLSTLIKYYFPNTITDYSWVDCLELLHH